MPENSSSSESWSHQNAYESLKANAKYVAGLENARTLIRQSRQIRYLRYVQLVHQQITDVRAEEEHIGPETEQVPSPPAEEAILECAAA